MRTLCDRAGVKYFRYHALRHFGASLLEQANVSIGSIQRLLGHENRLTTELYLHSIGESERQAMDVGGGLYAWQKRSDKLVERDEVGSISGDRRRGRAVARG